MRYAVLGDVHGNLLALEAVIKAAQERSVDAFLFVGDAVGYGPDPVGCLEQFVRLQSEGRLAWVVGNHERYVRGDLLPTGYSKEAKTTLDWTRRILLPIQPLWKFVNGAHLTVEINGMIWLTHDSISVPGNVGYHRWAQNAQVELASLTKAGGVVCFYGHTHKMRTEMLRKGKSVVLVPMSLHMGDGLDLNPIQFETGDVAWVGAGSVGIPINPSRHAEYLILDDSEWRIEKYEVPYDRESAKRRVIELLSEPCGEDVATKIARWL